MFAHLAGKLLPQSIVAKIGDYANFSTHHQKLKEKTSQFHILFPQVSFHFHALNLKWLRKSGKIPKSGCYNIALRRMCLNYRYIKNTVKISFLTLRYIKNKSTKKLKIQTISAGQVGQIG